MWCAGCDRNMWSLSHLVPKNYCIFCQMSDLTTILYSMWWPLVCKQSDKSLSLCLRTSGNHIEHQSPISTQKTFYMGNTTSASITVVFSTNCSWKFTLSHIRCVVILNSKLWTTRKHTASLWNHQKHCMCSNPNIYTTQQRYLFQRSLHEVQIVQIVQILL